MRALLFTAMRDAFSFIADGQLLDVRVLLFLLHMDVVARKLVALWIAFCPETFVSSW